MIFIKDEKGETSYSKGIKAEKIAGKYLQEEGFSIIKGRYKTKFGEIDIIAKQGNLLCFVEVKVRDRLEDAMESITKRLQKRIENSALFFICEYPEYMDYDMRFDVITISGDISGDMKISHLDNAWLASS